MSDPDLKEPFDIEVSCYSGYRYGERPVSFKLLEKNFAVKEIIDQWYGEDYLYFKIRADDQRIYLLKYDQAKDQWSLTGLVPEKKGPGHLELFD
jgi:hypothetical protein